ncbi:hypothetical protein [Streptomyces asiaticus]|uniref:hypothetical protein n=1 Tax=Streptomyces asiaticus TaxID=114695 RepID=UPI0035588458
MALRAINNAPHVSRAKREAVERAVRQLGWVPNRDLRASGHRGRTRPVPRLPGRHAGGRPRSVPPQEGDFAEPSGAAAVAALLANTPTWAGRSPPTTTWAPRPPSAGCGGSAARGRPTGARRHCDDQRRTSPWS